MKNERIGECMNERMGALYKQKKEKIKEIHTGEPRKF